MTEAYFEPLGTDDGWEVFRATPHTVSAWGPDLQHGSPPSAVLTRAMDRLERAESTRIARVTVDLLGPVPLGEVRTRARIVRPGRRIQLLEAELEAGGRIVARASAWRMAVGDTAEVEQSADRPRELPEVDHDSGFFDRWTSGYIDSLEIRGAQDGVVWARPTLPLVSGEEMTPAERVMSVADIANGVGAVLEPDEWRFLNTDLVTHLHRRPVGEWIGVTADASIGPDGVGATSGTLYDEAGAIGHTLQALLVERV
ncbi:thioesterase [Dietzia sp. UCD-THP]|uniref:thioesterase family protein n=1 Tax=Dietzia sp. UCD-THP TaxID=1292020 RepID=UPI00037E7129|nr:thioesterase family protein [Dietzia sp. UCD-THP]EYT63883.1 thioesterase [Dietzia sp. UCD-THP]